MNMCLFSLVARADSVQPLHVFNACLVRIFSWPEQTVHSPSRAKLLARSTARSDAESLMGTRAVRGPASRRPARRPWSAERRRWRRWNGGGADGTAVAPMERRWRGTGADGRAMAPTAVDALCVAGCVVMVWPTMRDAPNAACRRNPRRVQARPEGAGGARRLAGPDRHTAPAQAYRAC